MDTYIIEKANKVLRTFAPRLIFIQRRNRLCLRYEKQSWQSEAPSVTKIIEVQVAKHSGALCINYGRLGMGGTMAMAVGQLARWIRGQSRVPIVAWKYWASPTIFLAGNNSDIMLRYIQESNYDDGKATKCVLCGADKCGDWWSLNSIVGPCCSLGRCVTLER